MKAEIVAIGSELVSGQSLDTNSQWISKGLGGVGIPVRFHTTLGDDLDENIAAFRFAVDRADLVVMSGGLGPTQDDLTREALASTAGVSLVEDQASLDAIQAMFARRNRIMPDRNKVQALLPEGAEALFNRVGTAPGIWMSVGKTRIACLPGVPHEMKIMFDEQVLLRLRATGIAHRVIAQRKINLFGKGESEIEAEALDLTARGRNPEVGITAHEAMISFRIIAEATTREEAEAAMEPTVATIYERFGQLVLGEGTCNVPEALARELARTRSTLALAESCTGGLLAESLTNIPGISASFPGGVVSYSNQAKADLLGVDPALIAEHGAVSAEVAAAMAIGVRAKFKSDIGLSVTGVAGPTGGTPEKPVGLVYLGLATDHGVQTRKLEIGPEQPRTVIRQRASSSGLNWVRLSLLGKADSRGALF